MEAAQLQVGHPGSLGSLWCPVQQEWTGTELSSKPPLLSCQAALPKSCLQPQGHLCRAGELCSPTQLRPEHPPAYPSSVSPPQLLQLQKESRNSLRPCCPPEGEWRWVFALEGKGTGTEQRCSPSSGSLCPLCGMGTVGNLSCLPLGCGNHDSSEIGNAGASGAEADEGCRVLMVTSLFFFFPSRLPPPTQHPQLVQGTEGAVGAGWCPVGYKERQAVSWRWLPLSLTRIYVHALRSWGNFSKQSARQIFPIHTCSAPDVQQFCVRPSDSATRTIPLNTSLHHLLLGAPENQLLQRVHTQPELEP